MRDETLVRSNDFLGCFNDKSERLQQYHWYARETETEKGRKRISASSSLF